MDQAGSKRIMLPSVAMGTARRGEEEHGGNAVAIVAITDESNLRNPSEIVP